MSMIGNPIRRGQLFIRQCGRPSREFDWKSKPQGYGYAMVGIAEIDEMADLQMEAVHDFAAVFTDHSGIMSFTGSSRPLEAIFACSDVATIIDRVYRTVSKEHEALGYSGGGMILRRTRAPSPPGTFVAAVMIVVTLPSLILPDAHMASFCTVADGNSRSPLGTIEFSLTGPCNSKTNGEALAAVHKSALWGWAEEPFGFMSLMRLDKIDQASRLQILELEGCADQAELDALRRSTQHAVASNKDPKYHTFLKAMHRRGLVLPWDTCPTASEAAARGQAAYEAILEIEKDAA